MPDGVEAAGKSSKGVKKSVAEPDGEDSVLLTAALCGADCVVKPAAEHAAKGKLHGAGQG